MSTEPVGQVKAHVAHVAGGHSDWLWRGCVGPLVAGVPQLDERGLVSRLDRLVVSAQPTSDLPPGFVTKSSSEKCLPLLLAKGVDSQGEAQTTLPDQAR